MKRMLIVLLLTILAVTQAAFAVGNRNVSIRGDWGTALYNDVVVQGDYAYCAAAEGGLEIIDVSDPANPRFVTGRESGGCAIDVDVKGNFTFILNSNNGLKVFFTYYLESPKEVLSYEGKNLSSITLDGDYLYMTSSGDSYKMIAFDVSRPHKAKRIGIYYPKEEGANGNYDLYDVAIKGKFAYLVLGYYDSNLGEYVGRMHVLRTYSSNPPHYEKSFSDLTLPQRIELKDDVAYICDSAKGLVLVDISTFGNLAKIAVYDDKVYRDVKFSGDYAYISFNDGGIEVMDVSNPRAPVSVGIYNSNQSFMQHYAVNDHVYVASYWNGLQIVDFTTPAAPVKVGAYEQIFNPTGIYVKDNLAYVADENVPGMNILDVSSPVAPKQKSTWAPDGEEKALADLKVKDDLALALVRNRGLYIVDVANPGAPQELSRYLIDEYPSALCYDGNYAYITNSYGMEILDISNPAAPVKTGGINIDGSPGKIIVQGNYAYTASDSEFQIIDISNPANPARIFRKSYYNGNPYIYVKGNYLYVKGMTQCALDIYNISNPHVPVKEGTYQAATELDIISDMVVDGDFAYFTDKNVGLLVVDVSDPTRPKQVGHYTSFKGLERLYVEGDYIYCTNNFNTGRMKIYSFSNKTIPEITLNLDKTVLNFGMKLPDIYSGTQSIRVSRQNEETLDWAVGRVGNFFSVNPIFGTNEGIITVDLLPELLQIEGEYRETFTVSAPYANNSPQSVEVVVRVTGSQTQSVPFGVFETPLEGTTSVGSIPVTGWALDDIGVQSVQIYREDNNQALVYIGDAIEVEGARPDVAIAYPAYPENFKAGWGYMLLTNYLPNGGNGTFRLHAVATDYEGNHTTLGIKTIYCDNANAVNPFGTIDTPEQGGIVSGRLYVNYGWVLTPLPNTIPKDGSTVNVFVDGAYKGRPIYNQYREDIAALFPAYNNSDGAVGYFYFAPLKIENGVHIIQWTAKDDAGNTEGIGSRFFTVYNEHPRVNENRMENVPGMKVTGDIEGIPRDVTSTVRFKKGFDMEKETRLAAPENDGSTRIPIEELERLEIHFEKEISNGVKSYWKLATPIIGSTMDSEKSIFYWSPGPGFVGTYRLIFTNTDSLGRTTKKTVWIDVNPKQTHTNRKWNK
jgi:hypothetical protein